MVRLLSSPGAFLSVAALALLGTLASASGLPADAPLAETPQPQQPPTFRNGAAVAEGCGDVSLDQVVARRSAALPQHEVALRLQQRAQAGAGRRDQLCRG